MAYSPPTPNGYSDTNRDRANGSDRDRDASSTPLPPPSSFSTNAAMKALKAQRRTSFEILQDLAGPESQLPLPRKEGSISINARRDRGGDEIKEGVPTDFNHANGSELNGYGQSRRSSSPTRTLSRELYLFFDIFVEHCIVMLNSVL